ncbi:MAG: EAL domain-containing protein [Burkholderiaceae bacterium]|nr:EAL domain-containing protein [Burkholderiaceae bacterium]
MTLFDDTSLLLPAQRARRIGQVMAAISAAIGLALLPRLLTGTWGEVVPMMAATLAAQAVAAWLLRRRRLQAAAGLMLGSLMVMLGYFIVRGQGLRDVSIMGIPAILAFAALLGNRRLFVFLLTAALTVCLGVGLANVVGWRVQRPPVYRPTEVIDVSVILLATAFAINMMARDLGRSLQRLVAENRTVRESQQRIAQLARRDALTGLPNRMAAREQFDNAVQAIRAQGGRLALLYVDLDQFKTVNDSLGHPAGDDLLRCIGQRLNSLLQPDDSVARLGGDEFLVLVRRGDDSDRVAEVAQGMLDAIAAPLELEGMELHGSGSIGVAMFPDDGQDFDSLLKKADIAMYRAKDAGRNAFRFFDAQMNAHVAEHLQLVAWIRRALKQQQFEVYYQPQIDLDSGRVVGAEALLRWRHPEQGMISPARFIPVAEHSGQIVELGEWVLHQACRQAQAWREQGLGDVVISVNMSPVQARRGDMERSVDEALQASGLPPALLELELTESLLIDETDQLTAMLTRLRSRGITFAIDDFGTGYSNLAYLKRFEVERLKIDQSFIRRLTVNPDDEAIVQAILQMAAALKLGVIAEGVEDEATLRRLFALGCRQGQGYHWSPAIPAGRFEAFVRERHGLPEAACPA